MREALDQSCQDRKPALPTAVRTFHVDGSESGVVASSEPRLMWIGAMLKNGNGGEVGGLEVGDQTSYLICDIGLQTLQGSFHVDTTFLGELIVSFHNFFCQQGPATPA